MRHVACLLCAAVACAPARAGDDQNQYEDQVITRCAHQRAARTVHVGGWERASSVRDLEAAFPGKLRKAEAGENPDEAADWFALVAGNRGEWRKADAVAAGLGPMYERWAQRLDLGPAPSIRKDEFMRFAQLIINNMAAAQAQGGAAAGTGTDADADKVFRVLDRDGDGELIGDELTIGLKEDKGRADADGNGRIGKDEYREYLKRKVAAKADALVAKAAQAARGPDGRPGGKAGAGLPVWFTDLDEDEDGQISLFEWRKGRPIALFREMDLNGDGLLTKEEYLRHVKMNEDALKPKKKAGKRP